LALLKRTDASDWVISSSSLRLAWSVLYYYRFILSGKKWKLWTCTSVSTIIKL
jgi:hypothetical protein